MKNSLLLCFSLVFVLSKGHAQIQDSVLTYGIQKVIHAAVLNEDRKYFVALPDDYDPNAQARYPVLYVLDAEINFQLLTGINKFLTKGRVSIIPKMIVVGILNTDRTRDLTPSKAKDAADLKQQKGGSYKNSGGADRFLSFIRSELRPEIEKQYRTNGYNLFAGHSFGGLTVLHAYLNHSSDFDAYISVDPSLWWDNNKLLSTALDRKTPVSKAGKILYIGRSGPSEEAKQPGLPDLDTRIRAEALPGFRFKLEEFRAETHGTVALPAFFDALKFLFIENKKN